MSSIHVRTSTAGRMFSSKLMERNVATSSEVTNFPPPWHFLCSENILTCRTQRYTLLYSQRTHLCTSYIHVYKTQSNARPSIQKQSATKKLSCLGCISVPVLEKTKLNKEFTKHKLSHVLHDCEYSGEQLKWVEGEGSRHRDRGRWASWVCLFYWG